MRFGRHFLSRNISELDGKPVGKHRKSCSSTEFSRSQRVAEDSPRMMAAAGCLVRGSGGACKTGGMTLLSRDLAPSVLVRLGFAIYLIIKPAFLICSKVSKVIFSPSWSRERERETSGLPSTFTSWWQTSEANNPFLSVFQLPSLLAEAHST